MNNIQDNLQIIGAKIDHYSSLYQRPKNTVKLLAVSKKHSVESIRTAFDYGHRAFGESYVQELIEKDNLLNDLSIAWHFIGPLQSNKAKKIADIAQWVHSIDRLKVATILSNNRSDKLPPLSVCLQTNISGENSKSGINPNDLLALALDVIKLPNIQLRGLMVIPAPESDFHKQRSVFTKVNELKKTLESDLRKNGEAVTLDTLSMGMSNDTEAAIAEGATIVRIGTAIFGKREY